MYRYISAFLSLFILTGNLMAQEPDDLLTRIATGEDRKVLFRNEASAGAYIHSAIGMGISARRGYHVTGTRKKMLEIDMSNFKHLKEVKTTSPYNNTNNSKYYYGKKYSLFLIRGGYGYKGTMHKKSARKNVSINYIGFAGITLAFAKPTYLEILYQNVNGSNVVETEKYDEDKHTPYNIYGKAPFVVGLDKLRLFPAGYVKAGLHFDFAEAYNEIRAIEAGVIMDIYPVAIDRMAFNRKRNILPSVYLKMIWGVKWF